MDLRRPLCCRGPIQASPKTPRKRTITVALPLGVDCGFHQRSGGISCPYLDAHASKARLRRTLSRTTVSLTCVALTSPSGADSGTLGRRATVPMSHATTARLLRQVPREPDCVVEVQGLASPTLARNRVERAGERRRGKAVSRSRSCAAVREQTGQVSVARRACDGGDEAGGLQADREGEDDGLCLGGVESGERPAGRAGEVALDKQRPRKHCRISGTSRSTPSSLASRSACVPKSMAASRSPSSAPGRPRWRAARPVRFARTSVCIGLARRCRSGTARRKPTCQQTIAASASRAQAARPTHPAAEFDRIVRRTGRGRIASFGQDAAHPHRR